MVSCYWGGRLRSFLKCCRKHEPAVETHRHSPLIHIKASSTMMRQVYPGDPRGQFKDLRHDCTTNHPSASDYRALVFSHDYRDLIRGACATTRHRSLRFRLKSSV